MKNIIGMTIRITITAVIVLLIAIGLGWFFVNYLSHTKSDKMPVVNTVNTDSLAAIKPNVRYAKKTLSIDAVSLYEVHMKNGDVVYVTISNAPGVTSSVGLSKENVTVEN